MRERTPFPRALFERLPKLQAADHHRQAQRLDRSRRRQGPQRGRVRHGRRRPADRRAGGRADAGAGPPPARGVPDHARPAAAGRRRSAPTLEGRTLGIVGLGNLGTRVAQDRRRHRHEGDRLEREPHAPSAPRSAAPSASTRTSCSGRADVITHPHGAVAAHAGSSARASSPS